MAMTVNRKDFRREIVSDDYIPDISDLDDHEREQYANGEFGFVGVFAHITLMLPHGSDGDSIVHAIQSPGVWGIDSRSDEDYLNEVFADECDTLASMLRALGVEVQE